MGNKLNQRGYCFYRHTVYLLFLTQEKIKKSQAKFKNCKLRYVTRIKGNCYYLMIYIFIYFFLLPYMTDSKISYVLSLLCNKLILKILKNNKTCLFYSAQQGYACITANYEGITLPRYGGSYTVNNVLYTFIHTCSLDTWFAIIKFLDQDKMLKCSNMRTFST